MELLETILLAHAKVEVQLAGERYRLSYADLVVYENSRRRIRGRWMPYAFRSIEQLRYDFERDVEAVGGRLA